MSLPTLAVLSDRMDVAAHAFAQHLTTCQLDCCPQTLYLAREADLAAEVYMHERSRLARKNAAPRGYCAHAAQIKSPCARCAFEPAKP